MIPSTFADVLREKIRTRASFIKILANYKSEERAAFLLRKCQEPVRRDTTEDSSIEFIGYRMPQHKQNGYTVLFTKLQSTKVGRASSIF